MSRMPRETFSSYHIRIGQDYYLQTYFLYISALHIKLPYLVLWKFFIPGQEVVHLHGYPSPEITIRTDDEVGVESGSMRTGGTQCVCCHKAAVDVEWNSRIWGPYLYDKDPSICVANWSTEYKVRWWRFNKYYHQTINVNRMGVAAGAKMTTT